jgi:hypothetical protein
MRFYASPHFCPSSILPWTDNYFIGAANGSRIMTMALVEAESAVAERRRGLRIRQNRPIKMFEPIAAKYFGGQTRDISATGLRIELPVSTPVVKGRLVSIHVGLNEAGHALANRREMIPAKIVWIDRSAARKTGRMTAGIEFLASIAAHLDAA